MGGGAFWSSLFVIVLVPGLVRLTFFCLLYSTKRGGGDLAVELLLGEFWLDGFWLDVMAVSLASSVLSATLHQGEFCYCFGTLPGAGSTTIYISQARGWFQQDMIIVSMAREEGG